MRMPKPLAPLAGVALLLAASALPAQEWRGKGRVEGTVKNTKGEPIAGAKVSLRWTKSGRGGPDVTTNKSGHWAFFGLAGGSWDIDFEASGYQTKKISAQFQEAERNQPIDIQLEPVPEAQASHEELQVGGKKVSPETAAAIEAGNAALTSKDYTLARESYLKALVEMPDYTPLLMRVAAAYYGEGKIEEALKYARQAADKDPADATAWKMIAELELSRGNLEAGKEALSKVPADKITATSQLNMGILFYNKKQPAAAEEAFSKAIELSPDLADAYYYRGLARLSLKGKTAEAKADLNKYLELAPNGSEAETVKELLKSL